MLASKRSAGVAPEVNLRNPSTQVIKVSKWGIYAGSEIQDRHQQKSKTGVISGSPKSTDVLHFF